MLRQIEGKWWCLSWDEGQTNQTVSEGSLLINLEQSGNKWL